MSWIGPVRSVRPLTNEALKREGLRVAPADCRVVPRGVPQAQRHRGLRRVREPHKDRVLLQPRRVAQPRGGHEAPNAGPGAEVEHADGLVRAAGLCERGDGRRGLRRAGAEQGEVQGVVVHAGRAPYVQLRCAAGAGFDPLRLGLLGVSVSVVMSRRLRRRRVAGPGGLGRGGEAVALLLGAVAHDEAGEQAQAARSPQRARGQRARRGSTPRQRAGTEASQLRRRPHPHRTWGRAVEQPALARGLTRAQSIRP